MTCQTSATVFLLFSTNPLKIILSAITCVSKLTRGLIKKNKTCDEFGHETYSLLNQIDGPTLS